MKNRMREICSSGSARGEGGNVLTYSAPTLPPRSDARKHELSGEQRAAFADQFRPFLETFGYDPD